MPSLHRARRFCWLALLGALSGVSGGCSNGRGSVNEPPASPPAVAPPTQPAQATFTVGGTISGLNGGGLVLQNNGGDDLSIAANGAFTFNDRVADRAAYTVTVRSHPAGQSCAITNAAGTVANANVTNVQVSCASGQFTIAGTVSGLAGSGLALQLNGNQPLPILSNGSFSFPTPLSAGTQYRVTIQSQPSNPAQVCTIAGNQGVIGTTNVTSVRVSCAANTFSIGGTVNGLLGSGLVLQNNGSNSIEVESNGAFTFGAELAAGAAYNVTVRTQPSNPAQVCTVRNARGTVGTADISNVTVSCNTSDFTIGGTVKDLTGSGLVLRNNGADELTIDSNGTFTFDTGLPPGAGYNVTVAAQPTNPSQSCTISNGSGVVGSSNVTNIIVQCSTQGFLVRGRVRDLRGSGLVLQNNGSDNLAIASNGRFEFSTPLPSGAPYNVTVAQQPRNPDQTCRVNRGAGTIGNSDIDDVDVRCRRDDDDDDDDDEGDD